MAKKKPELEIKKFSDMEDWSVANAKKNKEVKRTKASSDRDFGVEVGKAVQELFKKYGVGIYSIEQGDFCKDNSIVMPREKNSVEYRVTLGSYKTTDELIEEFGTDDPEQFLKDNGGEKDSNYEYFMDIYNDVMDSKVEAFGRYSDVQFSIFTGGVITDIDSEDGKILAWAKAFVYYTILNKCNFKRGTSDYLDSLRDTENFKKYLKANECQLSIDNVEDVERWCYRLYKDGSFFNKFEDNIDKGVLDSILRGLDNLVIKYVSTVKK